MWLVPRAEYEAMGLAVLTQELTPQELVDGVIPWTDPTVVMRHGVECVHFCPDDVMDLLQVARGQASRFRITKLVTDNTGAGDDAIEQGGRTTPDTQGEAED